jgi:hypothetical protein
MRNFIDCKIIMFKLQNQNFPKKMYLLLSLCDLITTLKSEWKTLFFFLNYKKLDFYTSIRSISRSVYVIKAKGNY